MDYLNSKANEIHIDQCRHHSTPLRTTLIADNWEFVAVHIRSYTVSEYSWYRFHNSIESKLNCQDFVRSWGHQLPIHLKIKHFNCSLLQRTICCSLTSAYAQIHFENCKSDSMRKESFNSIIETIKWSLSSYKKER